MRLITGGTGYLGAYVVAELLAAQDEDLILLTRARDTEEAELKLWRNVQLRLGPEAFSTIRRRIRWVLGDLQRPGLGLSRTHRSLVESTCTSVVHIAASLNRRSSKQCFNHNLRGTLALLTLARRLADAGRLRRFAYMSTVAVAGRRQSEEVNEDEAVDFERSDYDPYARTKKFAEHMIAELLEDIPQLVFRPSIVMGDSQTARTTQFSMVRTFCTLVDWPCLPLPPDGRLDIVPADFVARAMVAILLKDRPRHRIYHLSAGRSSPTNRQVAQHIAQALGRPAPAFVPRAERLFAWAVREIAATAGRAPLQQGARLLEAFLPYLCFDTVFDNARICAEVGESPRPFLEYCEELYRFSRSVNYRYPYLPLSTQKTL